MSKHYETEFMKKIVRLHLEEGSNLKGLASEYGVFNARNCEEVDHASEKLG